MGYTRTLQTRNPRQQALGDVICLEGDCAVGKQLVNEMQAVYKQFSGYGKNELSDADVSFRAKFSSTVTQVVEQFQREDAKLSRQIPFSVVCCTIKDIGVKAQSLSRQMRDYMKVAQPAATPVKSPHDPSTNPVANLADKVLKTGLLLGAGYLAFNFLAARIK